MKAKVLADISMMMWLEFRAKGFKTRVRCSKNSLSRYVESEGNFRIRISDHYPTAENTRFDYNIVVKDDPSKAMAAARKLVARLAGESEAAAA